MNAAIHQEWARVRSADLYRRAERERMVLAARHRRKQQARDQMATLPLLTRSLLTLLCARRLRRTRWRSAKPGTPQPGALTPPSPRA